MCFDGVTRRLSTALGLAAAAWGGPPPQMDFESRNLATLDGDDRLVVLAELVGVEGAPQRDLQLRQREGPSRGRGVVRGGAISAQRPRAGERAVGVADQVFGAGLGRRPAGDPD